MMRRILLALLLLFSGQAFAQDSLNTVTILPRVRTMVNSSSTVAVSNTFQQVFAASSTRLGCAIQNNGSGTMWVFFGATASATKGTSVVLAAGQSVYCQASAGLTYQGEVAITGTAGDAFYAAAQ